ncbi:MAG: sulfatase [Opitutaceae bacterium]|nr:sulfatase [Opitutaceae bacterium]
MAACSAVRAGAPATASKPNVIVILADDLGYGDLGIQGSRTLATPRIDRMAREGVRFTAAYAAAPFCSPSRAALLTGRLPARCGLPYVMFPAEHHGLPEAEITLAELLKTQGYATACIGKWHLGWDRAFRPRRHGFDVFFGLPYSNDSNEWPVGAPFMQVMGLEPLPLMEGDRVVEAPVDQSQLTRRYTERALAFIRDNRTRPFFLYLPHTMPHVPQYASEKFAGNSKGGLYGDAVEELDWSTGAILDTLRELKLEENTLVIFTSDNGAAIRRAANAPGKARDSAAPKKQAAGGGERFPGRSFGGDNGPLRAGKGTTFEGGTRVPFIARWPGQIAAARVSDAPISLMDVFPTMAQLAGASLPGDRTYDGRNIERELIRGAAAAETEQRPMFYYFGYQLQAVREGRWKLLVAVDRRPEPRPVSLWFEHLPRVFETQHRLLAEPELYDLSQDIGETRNVAAQHPEVVTRLAKLAREFDAALQPDQRPMQFVPGPTPPAPQTIRTPQTDLSAWRDSNP